MIKFSVLSIKAFTNMYNLHVVMLQSNQVFFFFTYSSICLRSLLSIQ